MVLSLTSIAPAVGFHISHPSQKTLNHLKSSSSLDRNAHLQNGSKALLGEETVKEKDKWKIQTQPSSLEEVVAQTANW